VVIKWEQAALGRLNTRYSGYQTQLASNDLSQQADNPAESGFLLATVVSKNMRGFSL